MSNYLFIVASQSASPAIRAWITQHTDHADLYVGQLSGERTLYIVSRDVHRSVRDMEYMRGTLVSEQPPALAFGIEGWRMAPETSHLGDAGGEFMHAAWADEVTLTRDVFGNARLLYFDTDDVAAASDSLLVLADLQTHLGMKVRANEEVLMARATLNEVAAQQTSSRTIIESIAYLPAGRHLVANGTRWRVWGRTVGDRVRDDSGSHADALREGATRVAEVCSALAHIPRWTPILSLSGGYDSRLVLAGVVAAGAAKGFRSSTMDGGPAFRRDLEIGRALGRRFGLGSPEPRPALVGSGEDPSEIEMWASSLFGVYDGLGPRATRASSDGRIGVTGIGAEIHKGNWGWSTLAEMLEFAAPVGAVRDALQAELTIAMDDVGGSGDLRNASELLYLGFRNGIHSAAGHISLQMVSVVPVMQLSLARAGHKRTDDGQRDGGATFAGRADGIRDMIALLSPEVCAFEYDKPARNVSLEEALDRQRELGGPLSDIAGTPVLGDPAEIPSGPSSLALSVARRLGLQGTLDATTVVDDGRRIAQEMSSTVLRETYLSLADNASWQLGRNQHDIRRAGKVPVRMLTLRVLEALGAL